MSEANDHHGASIRTDQRGGFQIAALIMSSVAALATVGGWVWFGGRLAQRVDTHDLVLKELERRGDVERDKNAEQATQLAVNSQQYAEIIEQLKQIRADLRQPVRIR